MPPQMKQQQPLQWEQEERSVEFSKTTHRSPTLQELEAANTWQKAADPSTGRTYYYDSITRQSQWEKVGNTIDRICYAEIRRRKNIPCSLPFVFNSSRSLSLFSLMTTNKQPREIRAIEKRIKKEQRQKQEKFFREMERNLKASLARGEVVPGKREVEKEGPPQEPINSAPTPETSKQRIRTISAVNEHLLAQLSLQEEPSQPPLMKQQPPPQSSSTGNGHSSSPIAGRPPLPSQRSRSNVFAAPAPQPELTKSSTMPSYNSMDSLELSPEDNADSKRIVDTDMLRGIDLLDSIDAAGVSSPEQDFDNQKKKSPEKAAAMTPLKHVRSHTANRVQDVQDTMEKPDIDATINCVCSVYRAHIENSLQSAQPAAPSPATARINLDIFRDDFEHPARHSRPAAAPTVATIQAFYQEFYQRSQMEHDTIIMSLIYVERLMKMTHGALQPTPENWSSILITCMILASKVWGESIRSNGVWGLCAIHCVCMKRCG